MVRNSPSEKFCRAPADQAEALPKTKTKKIRVKKMYTINFFDAVMHAVPYKHGDAAVFAIIYCDSKYSAISAMLTQSSAWQWVEYVPQERCPGDGTSGGHLFKRDSTRVMISIVD